LGGWQRRIDRIALDQQLSILISQIQPQDGPVFADGLYGAYQPSLTFNATHSYNSFPAGFFNEGGFFPATTEQINSYTPGLSGPPPGDFPITLPARWRSKT
jgi:hypothetical protein